MSQYCHCRNDDDDKTPVPRDEEQKRVYKEALNEWLESKFSEFGKFSLFGGMAGAFYLGVKSYVWLKANHIIE